MEHRRRRLTYISKYMGGFSYSNTSYILSYLHGIVESHDPARICGLDLNSDLIKYGTNIDSEYPKY